MHLSYGHGERLFELLGYIKFVCRRLSDSSITNDSYVFFPQQFGYKYDITDNQANWILGNYDKLTAFQQKYVNQYLHYAYGLEDAV